MEMMMTNVQPIIKVNSEVFEHKRHFKVDLSSVKTMALDASIKLAASQTPVLTNVNVPETTVEKAPAAQVEMPFVLSIFIRKSLLGLLYAIGFLAWFLSSY